MVSMLVWVLAIGGSNHSDGYPPSISNTMFTDKESCIIAKNHLDINSTNSYEINSRVSCIRVNVLVPK